MYTDIPMKSMLLHIIKLLGYAHESWPQKSSCHIVFTCTNENPLLCIVKTTQTHNDFFCITSFPFSLSLALSLALSNTKESRSLISKSNFMHCNDIT